MLSLRPANDITNMIQDISAMNLLGQGETGGIEPAAVLKSQESERDENNGLTIEQRRIDTGRKKVLDSLF